MKKVFDQTVRDIKREVNKKVLKVPSIEQKVLDATSNEPWGPHGSHLADIAQATRNYNEYQMIMAVLWKRINDTGKNWRHVYKALTVLEYLVAHGSERVIDEIREHAYQISTLSDFQYIDSSGRDQGNNVRKKSQSLVTLVNDKERIQEARQKAAANRDKFRGPSSTGGMYRPGSYSSTSGGYGDRYDDDRYGYRDDDRNGYGRERDWSNRDEDRYGRGGDSYGRDNYSRDSDERYGRDGYRDDDYRGSQNNDEYRYGPRSRSSEREKDRSYEDDDPYSSRSGTGRADDQSPDERRVEHKLSEVNASAPPTYEEVIANSQNQATNGRDGRTVAAPPPKGSSPPPGNASEPQSASTLNVAVSSPVKEEDAYDEFDPRAPVSAVAPTGSSTAGVDLFGALSDSNSLALVPVTSETTASEPNVPVTSSFGANFVPLSSASAVLNQPAENPFGDAPFKAIPSEDSFTPQTQGSVAASSFQQQPAVSESSVPPEPAGPKAEPVSNFEFADTFPGITFAPASVPNAQFSLTTPEYSSQVPSTVHPSDDILGGILPQTGPAAGPVVSQSAFSAPAATSLTSQATFPAPLATPLTSQAAFPRAAATPLASQAAFSSPAATPLASQAAFSAPAATPLTSQAAFSAPVAAPLTSQASFSAPGATPLTSQPGFSAPAATPLASQAAFSAPAATPAAFQAGPLGSTANSLASQSITGGFANSAVPSQTGFVSMPATSHATVPGFTATPVASQANVPGFTPMPIASQATVQAPTATSMASQAGGQAPVRTLSGPAALPVASQASCLDVTGTTAKSQPPKDKFETKSTVWSDTLNRGLVNLNISGPKINPLADIGIDFDSINRMEKRKEKSSAASVTSTVTMGKAMGSGSGIGRAGASGLAAAPNPMMGGGMGMGMGAGAGMGMGMGMGGYGGMNRPMGVMGGMNQSMGTVVGMNQPVGMNMGMGMGMGIGTNMGMAQGAAQMRPASGLPQGGSGMPVGYSPMMGMGGYTPQQPYGGYR